MSNIVSFLNFNASPDLIGCDGSFLYTIRYNNKLIDTVRATPCNMYTILSMLEYARRIGYNEAEELCLQEI